LFSWKRRVREKNALAFLPIAGFFFLAMKKKIGHMHSYMILLLHSILLSACVVQLSHRYTCTPAQVPVSKHFLQTCLSHLIRCEKRKYNDDSHTRNRGNRINTFWYLRIE
jgi:hypothetical protein